MLLSRLHVDLKEAVHTEAKAQRLAPCDSFGCLGLDQVRKPRLQRDIRFENIRFDAVEEFNTGWRAYSARRLPLIPVETCHRFQAKVATDSD